MRAGAGLPIEELARRVAVYERVERALFETLGRWAASTPETEIRLRFAADSYKHAWHAELWAERMPQLRERAPAPPADGDPVDALLAAVAAPDATTDRLVGLARVLLPRLAAAYTAHLALASPISDAPVVRALELALRDEQDDWRATELLLQARLRTADAVADAARRQADLEALIAPSGGLVASP